MIVRARSPSALVTRLIPVAKNPPKRTLKPCVTAPAAASYSGSKEMYVVEPSFALRLLRVNLWFPAVPNLPSRASTVTTGNLSAVSLQVSVNDSPLSSVM